MASGRRSITRMRKYFVSCRRKDWDTDTLILFPIVPYPFSVGPRHIPEAFSNNRKPKEILKAKMTASGKMKFLVKWDDATDHVCSRCTTKEAYVCAKTARFICPKLVIEFYQSRIEWGATQEAAEGEPECINALIEQHQLKKLTVKL